MSNLPVRTVVHPLTHSEPCDRLCNAYPFQAESGDGISTTRPPGNGQKGRREDTICQPWHGRVWGQTDKVWYQKGTHQKRYKCTTYETTKIYKRYTQEKVQMCTYETWKVQKQKHRPEKVLITKHTPNKNKQKSTKPQTSLGELTSTSIFISPRRGPSLLPLRLRWLLLSLDPPLQRRPSRLRQNTATQTASQYNSSYQSQNETNKSGNWADIESFKKSNWVLHEQSPYKNWNSISIRVITVREKSNTSHTFVIIFLSSTKKICWHKRCFVATTQ